MGTFADRFGDYLPAGLQRQERTHPAKDALAFASGLLFGGCVAAVAAIFLAPTDGVTLRKRVGDSLGGLMGGDRSVAGYSSMYGTVDAANSPEAAPADEQTLAANSAPA